MRRELLPRWEYWLQEGATLALWLALALRVARGFIFTHQLWLKDSEIAGVCLLLSLMYLAGCLMPRAYGGIVSLLLGALAWLAAFSLLPRFGWPQWVLPLWLLGYCVVMLAGALGLRLLLTRRWYAQLSGHGFDWMLRWADERSFYARLLTTRVLRSLGYQP